jgi:hypothetical protein
MGSQSIVKRPVFEQLLRVCNSYTDRIPIAVTHHRHGAKRFQKPLTKAPIQYGKCQDFPVLLEAHDSIELTQSESEKQEKPLFIGSFSVSALPKRDASLLLVVQRRGTSTSGVFTSHVFSRLDSSSSQIVVLDAYRGHSHGLLEIRDPQASKDSEHPQRQEGLEFGSVVSVNSGEYECARAGGTRPLSTLMKVEPGSNYVALRIGAEGNKDFPEDIVVFPQESGSWRRCAPGFSALLVLLFTAFRG